jgi:CRP-like cAMP-binding protein
MQRITARMRDGNKLLAAMKAPDLDRLMPHLEEVALARGHVLYEPGQSIRRVYFPHDGFVSLVIVSDDGPGIETATIGYEGVVGLPLIMNQRISPSQAIVQVSGSASVMAVDALNRAMNDSASLRTLLGAYAQAFLAQIFQAVACNALHSTEERLAKWLLMSSDRVRSRGVPLTHEFIAEMLGVGRPTVSLVARTLQNAGLIQYRRGSITILDRPGLEEVSCSCYGIVCRAFEQLLPFTLCDPKKA